MTVPLPSRVLSGQIAAEVLSLVPERIRQPMCDRSTSSQAAADRLTAAKTIREVSKRHQEIGTGS